ncbi:hypothetical protein PYH37_001352 [Sinorhizobium numidicum]|uniref:Secreted protein n=1 Tax=Sinorhizobium numidicum TaxID=680248 RepID=A0ABY8CMU5_9HYPH|nr:hypothetical protein [Sinorhizobium numidicum]WEX73984.1 hypothetical protein PYH37_001352 [Sinorhizobium numidicum]WEX79969.1 hypothetical protein PYH38_001353 [Sinorhizobium numidicum]
MNFKHSSIFALALALGVSPLALSGIASAQGTQQSQQGTSGAQETETRRGDETSQSGSREDRCARADAPADCPDDSVDRPPKTTGTTGDTK